MRRSAILIPLALAACAAPAPRPAAAPPPPRPVAATDACIDIARIREARVVDERTIDFHLNDGRVMRSAMPAACPGLGLEKAFTYSTALTRLCPATSINVINQAGGPRLGAACALGAFTPMTPAP